MTDFKEPRTEIEWSRRAIINVVDVLAIHARSLTLVGAHAVLLRTMDLDVPRMPTGDGDLGVTPGLVGDVPSIEALLADAGYEHRTTARPGLWGRKPYDEPDGTRSFREKIDLLAPHGLSGTASRSKRGVPALQHAHGKLAVGNVLGLELAAFNRSLVTITDFADPRLATEIHVAEIPALILAKGSKIGERLREPRKGSVRDKDLGDLWRLMAVADPAEIAQVMSEFVDHPEVGSDVRQSLKWTSDVLRDPVSSERAKSAFDTFVDPAEIDRTFDRWGRVPLG
ncbi:hypothetical protein [Nocardioides cavernaquae]|uniref:Nucleotidyl transferase AbiEii/AbiGii toxin family protein n=1 Tax=Nocardioides cavernaquae TaxID=2321396 RepID=A0A3A5H5Y6_9ACTN|nr:hypothetical protein [Nocardioides cavernaquae]RJS45268.1 hypothetical protein D4739_02895 [Nocardioides cavernaquae]